MEPPLPPICDQRRLLATSTPCCHHAARQLHRSPLLTPGAIQRLRAAAHRRAQFRCQLLTGPCVFCMVIHFAAARRRAIEKGRMGVQLTLAQATGYLNAKGSWTQTCEQQQKPHKRKHELSSKATAQRTSNLTTRRKGKAQSGGCQGGSWRDVRAQATRARSQREEEGGVKEGKGWGERGGERGFMRPANVAAAGMCRCLFFACVHGSGSGAAGATRQKQAAAAQSLGTQSRVKSGGRRARRAPEAAKRARARTGGLEGMRMGIDWAVRGD